MPNSVQRSALIRLANGHSIHKTTAEALNRKGLIERVQPLGELRLTERGRQYV